MKAEEVLNLLQISRKTLHVYAHNGRIRYTVMPNKRYDYSEEDVYKILNKDVKRKNRSLCQGFDIKTEERSAEPDRSDEAVVLHERFHDKCDIFGYCIRNIL